jgi:hypothetical protein
MKPSYQLHEGFRMPMGFPTEGFGSGQSYQPLASDIFVSTYPKCGTTWMQNIIWLLVHDATPIGKDQRLDQLFPHVEEVGSAFVESLTEPRLVKTHLPFDMSPWHDRARYIYVARNPFDCAVSFYHHTRGFVKHYDFAQGSFADYFECFLSGEVDFGDYFDNVLSWLDQTHRENIYLTTYESMEADIRAVVSAVACFIGFDRAVANPRMLETIVEHSSFSSMQRDQRRWASERSADMPAFVRKGVVGDWQNHFDAKQLERLCDRVDEKDPDGRLRAMWPAIFEAVEQRIAAQAV